METIPAKTIVTHTKNSGWFGTDYNMNIYRGCCHGCIYCDSRSECYHIENFDQVRIKENALGIIENELRGKRNRGVVGTGAMSDPYNPFEKELRLTRRALELLDTYQYGVAIDTKSDLIARDIDILKNIQKHSPVLCKITVTTADDALSGKIEPHAPPSSERFEAIRKLTESGIFAGVLLMPILPFLEDSEENVLAVVRKAHLSGARFIYPLFGVTLRQNQREWFLQKLDELFPEKNYRTKYQYQYGNDYECRSPKTKELRQLFTAECDRLGILYRMRDIVKGYKAGYEEGQLSMFES